MFVLLSRMKIWGQVFGGKTGATPSYILFSGNRELYRLFRPTGKELENRALSPLFPHLQDEHLAPFAHRPRMEDQLRRLRRNKGIYEGAVPIYSCYGQHQMSNWLGCRLNLDLNVVA